MKIQIISDLHNEFEPLLHTDVLSDVLVLAGDIDIGVKGVEWAKQFTTPVIYVLGNHEYHEQNFAHLVGQCRETAEGSNVHVLDNDTVTIDDVKFIGCTLWADFLLFGKEPSERNQRLAEKSIDDYRLIRCGPGDRKLKAVDTKYAAEISRAFILQELQKRDCEKIVVVTHHAPSDRSRADIYRDDPLSAAYVTPMDDIIGEYSPALWVHGHMHNSSDYAIDQEHACTCTRVICNPRGYSPMELNPEFDPEKVVEV